MSGRRSGLHPMIWVGTSGYNYPEWKGTLLSARPAGGEDAPYYAARFSTVEINYTFYRIPTEKLLAGWAAATPDPSADAQGAAPHHPRREAAGVRRSDAGLLRHRGDARRQAGRAAVPVAADLQVRSGGLRRVSRRRARGRSRRLRVPPPSWLDDEVYARLRARDLALCIADSERLSTPVVRTADYGYFRLRDEGYTAADIERWAGDRRRVDRCARRFVYFKHEDGGQGPGIRTGARRRAGIVSGRQRLSAGPSPSGRTRPPPARPSSRRRHRARCRTRSRSGRRAGSRRR